MATTTTTTVDDKPTLHHMNNSQSQRILWLLEELSIPYTLVLHFRQTSGAAQHRAPPELKSIHPLGKSPLLVTSSGRVIAESSAIAAYLLTTFDTATKRFHGVPTSAANDWVRDESLTSFAGATMGPLTGIQLFLDILTAQMPWFVVRPLVGMFTRAVHNMFVGPEFRAQLAYLEAELEGREYFMGEEPGRPDFMLSWPVEFIVQRAWVPLDGYPRLVAWRERCQAREAWKSALNKGNGFDLTGF